MGASKWGRLDEAQAPVKRTMGSLGPRRRHTGPASCHLPFGRINPRRTGTHLWVLLFLIASLVVVLEKTDFSWKDLGVLKMTDCVGTAAV